MNKFDYQTYTQCHMYIHFFVIKMCFSLKKKGLKRLGMSQIRAKAIAKYLSVSSMIGSYRVWRRRWR